MNTFMKPALAAVLSAATLVAPAAVAPAAAQDNERVAFVNVQAVVANSSAFQTAQTQRQTTYASQLQQAETRRAAIQAQLTPLVQAFNTARSQPNADQASLQQQAAQIQQIQQNGQTELQQILAPVTLSQAYVEEQIRDQLGTAVQNAARAEGVTLVISPDTILHAESSHNLNEEVLAQLNTLIPSAQLVPPNGWLPAELRAQQEAAASAQPAAPAATGR